HHDADDDELPKADIQRDGAPDAGAEWNRRSCVRHAPQPLPVPALWALHHLRGDRSGERDLPAFRLGPLSAEATPGKSARGLLLQAAEEFRPRESSVQSEATWQPAATPNPVARPATRAARKKSVGSSIGSWKS